MTVLADYSRSEDERAVRMHASTEAHIKSLRVTWGISRRAAIEHLVAFAENDEESPVFTTAAGKPRKRRRQHAEASA